MRVFQTDGKTDILEFTNYERLDEDELFHQVMEKLQANPDIGLGKKGMGPSEDFYRCTIKGEPFTLWYDIDYGPSILSKSPAAIKSLTEYFNS